MTFPSKFRLLRRPIKWIRRNILRQAVAPDSMELREFIYLDEVSLRSLLSSQTGEMTDSKSEQNERSWSMEGGLLAALESEGVGKAEASSRFQTGNSLAVQTSKKATVQSWFRELHQMSRLRLISQVENVRPFRNSKQIAKHNNRSVSVTSAALERGKLIEMRVRLTADPIFRMGLMLHEFGAMAGEMPPEMLKGVEGLSQAGMWNKVLDRFLAGLIPVKSEAIDYRVVTCNSEEFIVHRNALEGLDIESFPLHIAGVTEHVAYWKDIRRVLFSDSTFTIMARVSRDRLHDHWSPVKLTELFASVAPDLAAQMTLAAKFIKPSGVPNTALKDDLRMVNALRSYKQLLMSHKKRDLTPNQDTRVERIIDFHRNHGETAELQSAAFAAVLHEICAATRLKFKPDVACELREDARIHAELPLLPSFQLEAAGSKPIADQKRSIEPQERILDVEFVAIYW